MNAEIEHALRTQNHQSFDEIQVGDWVIIGSGRSYLNYRVEKVERVLKTQIIAGGNKYRRDDGYEVGINCENAIRIKNFDLYINKIKVQEIKGMMFNIDNGVSNIYADSKNGDLVNRLLDQLNQVQQTLNELRKGGE